MNAKLKLLKLYEKLLGSHHEKIIALQCDLHKVEISMMAYKK